MTDCTILLDKSAAYYTLGCKLNFAETNSIARRLSDMGVRTAMEGEKADICIINTCSVTEVADHKCRQAISRMVRTHPGALVVVMGCYAQLQPARIAALEGVDIVLGAEEKARVVDYIVASLSMREASDFRQLMLTTNLPDIRSFAPSCSCGNRTRYFLKVQDGCDYYCTYCTIPFARGRSRNAPIADLVAQAQKVADEGGQEIVITGVNIGDFGHSTGESFLHLLRSLDAVEGIKRYRISSIEPNLLSDDVMRFCADSRAFMPHFHLPLQCGSDEVLRLMHRRYDTQLFAGRVERIRTLMPDAFIGVDVIVGTRGETSALFDESERFIRSVDVSQLHVFSYSERPGTKALNIAHSVSPDEKHERSQRLLALSDEKLHSFCQRFVGRRMEVLWEHGRDLNADGLHLYHGFTPNYVRVSAHAREDLDNTITTTLLDETNICYNT